MCVYTQTPCTISVKFAPRLCVFGCMWTSLSSICPDAVQFSTVCTFQWGWGDTRFGVVASDKCLRLHKPYHVISFWNSQLVYVQMHPILLLLVYLRTMFVVNAWAWAWTTHKARTMADTGAEGVALAIAEKAATEALVSIIWQFTLSFSLVAMFRHYW